MPGESRETPGPSTEPSFYSEESFTRQYRVLMTLGQGANAKVMLGQHRLTGAPVAIKALKKQKKWCHPTVSEVDIMRSLSHPNIVSLIQVIETEQHIYLIMEVAEGKQLFQCIRETGRMKENQARDVFKQLLSAVGYCHEAGIVHRDLKPDNVMLDNTGQVKIIDFGLGAKFKPGQNLEKMCGGLQFLAPEIFLRLPYDGVKVDIWTLGVLLYFMVTGTVPFPGPELSELRMQTLNGTYDIPYHLSRELRSIISRMLSISPKLRPSIRELIHHPWLLASDEDVSPNSQNPNPSCLDREIVTVMKHLGFDVQDIRDSVLHKKFNETMASYSLLRSQALHGDNRKNTAKVRNPALTPFPSVEDAATFPLVPRKRASEPSLCTLVSSTSNYLLGQRRKISAGLPPKTTSTVDRKYKRSMTTPAFTPLAAMGMTQKRAPSLRALHQKTRPCTVGRDTITPQIPSQTSAGAGEHGEEDWCLSLKAVLLCVTPDITSAMPEESGPHEMRGQQESREQAEDMMAQDVTMTRGRRPQTSD